MMKSLFLISVAGQYKQWKCSFVLQLSPHLCTTYSKMCTKYEIVNKRVINRFVLANRKKKTTSNITCSSQMNVQVMHNFGALCRFVNCWRTKWAMIQSWEAAPHAFLQRRQGQSFPDGYMVLENINRSNKIKWLKKQNKKKTKTNQKPPQCIY